MRRRRSPTAIGTGRPWPGRLRPDALLATPSRRTTHARGRRTGRSDAGRPRLGARSGRLRRPRRRHAGRADPDDRPAPSVRIRTTVGDDDRHPGADPGRATAGADMGRTRPRAAGTRGVRRKLPSTSASSGPAATSCRASGRTSGPGPARGRRGTRSRRRSSPATSVPPCRSTSSNAPAGDATPVARRRRSGPSSRRCSWRAISPGVHARRSAGGPAVILVVGVNGTGKTTTIGKLASRYAGEGRSVILAAADTFRAAAIDQLRIWADRAKVPMVAHAPGADPGAVVYDALDAAVARGADLVIADTAGRLHTKSNLMDELSKVRRVIDKRLPGAEPGDDLRARRDDRPERSRRRRRRSTRRSA